jgi:hypothetical protein
MGFFDRFKPQPRWRHPEAAVRVAAIDAIPDEEQDLLLQLAREDSEPSVRRAAVAKLSDAGVLAEIARTDPDDSVRGVARDLVIALAQDSADAGQAEIALCGLSDQRDLMVVARSAELEPVARAALDRLTEARLLSTIARQGTHASVRLAALDRLHDTQDLLAVAIKTEHRDAGLAALARLPQDRDTLETVAVRARSKVVQRRARGALHALAELDAPPVTALPAAQRRQQVCDILDALANSSDLSRAEERLAVLEREWTALAGEPSDEVAARYARGVERLKELLARSAEDRAAHEQQMRQLAEDIEAAASSRLAICERLEALDGPDAAAGLDEARTVWVAQAPWPEAARTSTQARQLEERFQRACAECEKRIARSAEREAAMRRLETLLAEAEAAAATEAIAEARATWARVAKAWKDAGGATAPPEMSARYRAAEAAYAQREHEWREARERENERTRLRCENACAQAEALAQAPDVQLKDADRLMRDLRSALDQAARLHPRKTGEELAERIKKAQAALMPRVQELRESEEWRRWANAGVQEDLCKEAEALRDVTEPAEAAKRLRDLQARWKKVGSAPQGRAEELWHRFRTACDEARARLEGYFAEQRQVEAESLARKEALVAQAEALADSTDWIRTAEELKRLQAEWQQSGPAPREAGQALWNRFRTACDRFFTRRKEDLAQRKHLWAENLARKEALCAQAEALAESTDWDHAVAEVKRLQAEWRTIGPVKKNKSEVVWNRFRAACDAFYERYKHRDQIGLTSNVAAREALCVELEAIVQPPEGVAPPEGDELRARVLDIWQRWRVSPRVPRAMVDTLEDRFDAALRAVLQRAPEVFRGSKLDFDATRRRMEQLCEQVETFLQGKITTTELAAAPAATLATMLRDALAANTIGGRVDEEAKWRTATAAVRDAQQTWQRLGPLPGEAGRQLQARFQRACRRFFELRGPAAPASQGPSRTTHA